MTGVQSHSNILFFQLKHVAERDVCVDPNAFGAILNNINNASASVIWGQTFTQMIEKSSISLVATTIYYNKLSDIFDVLNSSSRKAKVSLMRPLEKKLSWHRSFERVANG